MVLRKSFLCQNQSCPLDFGSPLSKTNASQRHRQKADKADKGSKHHFASGRASLLHAGMRSINRRIRYMCLCLFSRSYESSWAPLNVKTQPKEEGILCYAALFKKLFSGRESDIYKGACCRDSSCNVTRKLLNPAVERSALCTLL